MGLIRTVDPAVEPISLTTAKLHLNIESTDWDTLITGLITAARVACEEYTRRSFITQTWQLTLDAFPSTSEDLPIGLERRIEAISGYRRGPIYLDRPPVQFPLVSFKYIDTNGNLQDIDSNLAAPTMIQVEKGSGVEPRIWPAYQTSWPPTRYMMETVIVTYQAGYDSDGTKLPQMIKQAMLLQIATWFKYKENLVISTPGELSLGVKYLLSPYKVWRAA